MLCKIRKENKVWNERHAHKQMRICNVQSTFTGLKIVYAKTIYNRELEKLRN